MKTGISLLFGVFIFSLIIPSSYGQKSDSGAQNITSVINTARYILFGGSYSLIGEQRTNGLQPSESAVFKLDTYTGKTWILKVEKSVSGRVAYWVPVDETVSISVDNKEELKRDNSQKSPSKALKTLDE